MCVRVCVCMCVRVRVCVCEREEREKEEGERVGEIEIGTMRDNGLCYYPGFGVQPGVLRPSRSSSSS